jgi:hypothetical protein
VIQASAHLLFITDRPIVARAISAAGFYVTANAVSADGGFGTVDAVSADSAAHTGVGPSVIQSGSAYY